MAVTLRIECRTRHWRGVCFLALVLGPLSLLGATHGQGFALLPVRRSQASSRGAALCARGGEAEAANKEGAEAAAYTGVPPEKAVRELTDLVYSLYKPKPGEEPIQWTYVSRLNVNETTGLNQTLWRATLVLTRTNRSFVGSWERSTTAAQRQVALEAIDRRLGDIMYGCPRTTLNIILRAAFGHPERLVEFRTEDQKGVLRFRSLAVLPKELFPEGWAPAEEDLTGERSASKSEARLSAARAALLFLCKLAFVIPALKALSERSTNKGKARDAPGRGSTKVIFANAARGVSEKAMRKRFEQFGLLKELKLNQNSDGNFTGKGSAVYDHPLCAWVAVRMLNRSVQDGRVMLVEQQAASRAAGKHEKQMSWGKVTNPEAVLFYMNAPFKETFNDMLEHFREAGEVASFRYWVDEETGDSRGMGTVSYGSTEASTAALEELNGKVIGGRKLKVSPYVKH